MYGQYQKQKQFGEALRGVEADYGNPELNEQQRLIRAYQQLGGAGHPELAQQLGGQLSRLGGQSESFRNKLMGHQQEQQKLAQSFQNIQGLYSDPNLSQEQKVFGVFQELAQNPTLAKNLLGELQRPQRAEEQDIASQQFSKGYEAALEGDKAAFKDVINDPSTPVFVQNRLTNIWNQQQTRKDVQARELRNRQSLVQKSYSKATSDIQKRLELANKTERAQLEKELKKLKALERADLKRLLKNPDAYQNLHLWGNIDPEFLPEESEGEGAELAPAAEMEMVQEQPSDMQERIEFLNANFPPAQFKGKKKKDKAGRIYESDGKVWHLVQE